jgi:probable rRNA maturation factor
VALVSDRHIRNLNRTFRGKNTPTDVLSFPSESSRTSHPKHAAHPTHPTHPVHLGDIVISTDTARRQAAEYRHSYATELKVLALHGLLHLLGYDHDSRADAGRMARLEQRLRAAGGLREGLIERVRAQP